MNFNNRGRKIASVLSVLFFLCQQTGGAAVEITAMNNYEQAVGVPASTVNSPNPAEEPAKLPAEALDFLRQDNPLETFHDEQNDGHDRASVSEALDLFQPEYAAAVIVKNISAEDLRRLQELPFETAIVVLSGETVLFTTGNEAEIGSSTPAGELLKKASFISHVHSQGTEQEGPSSFDLKNAVEAPGLEYVITAAGTYAYNHQGIQNAGQKLSLEETAQLIEKAREASRQKADEDQTAARAGLNEFIREMDLYNQAPLETRETFRRALVPVSTLAELQAMKNDLAGDYFLTSNIDAAGVNWEPVGTGGNAFRGSFNGNGFKITNLTINRPAQDYVGLFGALESTGTIENVKLENVSILGRNNVGAVSGYMVLSELSNVSAEGGTVTGVDRTGGLVGESYNGLGINNSHSNVSISGNDETGGIVGKLWDGITNDINQSYALGTVTGRNEVGGLAGYSKSGDMIRSYAAGAVSGSDYVGGLVGMTTENAGIRDSYYSGSTVSGITQNTGGIAGLYGSYDDGIQRTYFSGHVTSSGGPGGFIGVYTAGVIADNYWDTTLNPGLQDTTHGDMAGITGRSTSAMQTQNNFTGWNFKDVWVMNGYPRLQQATAISTLKELKDMSLNLSAKYYLVSDINAAGVNWQPIGTGNDPFRGVFNPNAFRGAFNGNGHTISNLTSNRPAQDYVGLFGSLESAGTIENVKLENVSILGRNNVGAVSGYMFLTEFSNAAVEGGTVTGIDRVGGLIGESYNGLGMNDSHSNLNVSGNNEVGGIVGKLWDGNGNDITQSFARGTVSGVNEVGGLAGYSKSGDIVRSYASGNVTGQDYVGGLVGLTTENAGIRDSYYATGQVSATTATNRAGGIAGQYGSYDDGIQRTYFAGTVTSGGVPGGFIGVYTAGAIADNYWDTTLNPGLQDKSNGGMAGISGQTTAAMQTQSTFTNWDFATIWRMAGYPQFRSGVQDQTAPAGTVIINGNDVYANTPALSVRVNASEPIQFYTYRVDGGPWSAQLNFPGEDLSLSVSTQEGPRLIEILLYDFAGNVSSLLSDTIILDTTAPSGSAVVAGGSDYTNVQTNDVALNFTDNLAGLSEMRFKKTGDTDWGPWLAYNAATTVELSDPDELKVVEVQVRDAARNVGIAQDPVYFDDTIPPVGTIEIAAGAQYANTNTLNLHLTASDEGGSGIKDMRFSIDGGMTWSAWTAFAANYNLNVSGVPDGPLTVFYQVRDNCNNVREVNPPTVGLSFSAGNFIVSVQDPPGVLSYDVLFRASASSTSWTVLQHDAPVSGTGTSFYNVGPPQSPSGVYAVRVARNQGGSFSDLIILDRVLPAATLASVSKGNPALGQTYRDTRFNFTGVSDALSGLREIRYRVDGGAWSVTSLPAGTDLPLNIRLPEGWGTRNVQIEIEDHAGNIRPFAQNVTIEVSAYLADVDFKYFLNPFDPAHGAFEATHSYPHEGYDLRLYTQPSHFGFGAQLLANVLAGRIVVDYLTRDQAIAILKNMITSLLNDQTNPAIGVMGLLPWMNFDSATQDWRRDFDYSLGKTSKNGRRFMLGDNSNMAVAFAAALGALASAQDNAAGDIALIRTKLQAFLANQAAGYQCLASTTNNSDGAVRRGIIISENAAPGFSVSNCAQVFGGGNTVAFVNANDTNNPDTSIPVAFERLYGSEFRAGILFAVLNYNLPDAVYKNLTVEIENYTLQNDTTVYTVSPVDGGAFQMLWPALTTPELLNSTQARMQKNFLDVALDFAARNSQSGFLSASYAASGYAPNAGIAEIAHNSGGRNQTATSVYTLGAAFAADPARMTPFFQTMLQRFPGLVTGHGLWEGVDMTTPAGTIVQKQVFSNVASFILGILGTGGSDMLEYLNATQETRLNTTLWKPAGANVDVVSASTNAFSWPQTENGQLAPVTGTRSGDTYRVVTSSLRAVGTAFQLNNINASGKRLLIRYRASTNAASATAANLKIEFKDPNGLKIRQQVNQVVLKNTGQGTINTVTIDLPAFIGTAQVSEMVFVLTGSGGSLDVTFEDVDLVGQDSVTPLGAGGGEGGRPAAPSPQEIAKSQEYTLLSYTLFVNKARAEAAAKIASIENRLDELKRTRNKTKTEREEEARLRLQLKVSNAVFGDITKSGNSIDSYKSTLARKGLINQSLLDDMLINFFGIYAFLYQGQ